MPKSSRQSESRPSSSACGKRTRRGHLPDVEIPELSRLRDLYQVNDVQLTPRFCVKLVGTVMDAMFLHGIPSEGFLLWRTDMGFGEEMAIGVLGIIIRALESHEGDLIDSLGVHDGSPSQIDSLSVIQAFEDITHGYQTQPGNHVETGLANALMEKLGSDATLPNMRSLALLCYGALFRSEDLSLVLLKWSRCESVPTDVISQGALLEGFLAEFQADPVAVSVLILEPAKSLIVAAALGGFLRLFGPKTIGGRFELHDQRFRNVDRHPEVVLEFLSGKIATHDHWRSVSVLSGEGSNPESIIRPWRTLDSLTRVSERWPLSERTHEVKLDFPSIVKVKPAVPKTLQHLFDPRGILCSVAHAVVLDIVSLAGENMMYVIRPTKTSRKCVSAVREEFVVANRAFRDAVHAFLSLLIPIPDFDAHIAYKFDAAFPPSVACQGYIGYVLATLHVHEHEEACVRLPPRGVILCAEDGQYYMSCGLCSDLVCPKGYPQLDDVVVPCQQHQLKKHKKEIDPIVKRLSGIKRSGTDHCPLTDFLEYLQHAASISSQYIKFSQKKKYSLPKF